MSKIQTKNLGDSMFILKWKNMVEKIDKLIYSFIQNMSHTKIPHGFIQKLNRYIFQWTDSTEITCVLHGVQRDYQNLC